MKTLSKHSYSTLSALLMASLLFSSHLVWADTSDKLEELEKLYAKGYITDEVYKERRAEVMQENGDEVTLADLNGEWGLYTTSRIVPGTFSTKWEVKGDKNLEITEYSFENAFSPDPSQLGQNRAPIQLKINKLRLNGNQLFIQAYNPFMNRTLEYNLTVIDDSNLEGSWREVGISDLERALGMPVPKDSGKATLNRK